METLEKSRVCRLCGQQSNISVDIFDKNENHVRKINAILPILVHEMDFLPKQMCHRCSYKLEEFYKFYDECAKTDSRLKSQLSWMRKETPEKQIFKPMVKMNPFKIKTEPPDCNDSDSSDVFGHISSFGKFASPILTCSRCKCICDTTVKVSKSPVNVKTFSKETENQSENNSCIGIESCNKSKHSTISENINDSQTYHLNAKEAELKEKASPCVLNNSSDCNVSLDPYDGVNRALRPRKGSVDYVGPKKRVSHKLKKKFKNKMGIFDSEIVDPSQVIVTSSNSIHSSPFIKLEKVDGTLKNLRAHKNLEEFNKRVIEINHERRLHRDEDVNKKFFRRLENRSKKNFQKQESCKKRSFHKDEKIKRNSLQAEEIGIIKIVSDESKTYLQENESQKEMVLIVDENDQNCEVLTKKRSQSEKHQDVRILMENTGDLQQCLKNDVTRINKYDNGPNTDEVQIKQEIVKVLADNSNIIEEQSEQLPVEERARLINTVNNQKTSNLLNRLPMCPVVKLEKDYTCNVDYPRVKIMRHLIINDPEKLVNCASDNSVKDEITVLDDKIKKVKKSKREKILQSKSAKKKEKKSKCTNHTEKSRKMSKKKRKRLELVNIKKVAMENGTPDTPQTELKVYCEECNTCFRNRELFRLHPCYQN